MGGENSNLYLNVVHFSTPVLIRHMWQLKMADFLHRCPICVVLLVKSDSTEERALKNVNYCWNTNMYPYLETSGCQNSKQYLNVAYFFQHQC
jgi:hypothetical protein